MTIKIRYIINITSTVEDEQNLGSQGQKMTILGKRLSKSSFPKDASIV